jgi:hypothetical protein
MEAETDNDNQQAHENLPMVTDNNIVSFGEQGHSGLYHRKMQGATKIRANLKFPTSFELSLVDLLNLLFPKPYDVDVILVEMIRHLMLACLSYG